MRYTEQFHEANINQSNYSQTIQNELSEIINQEKELQKISLETPKNNLSLEGVQNPWQNAEKYDRNSIRLMRVFRLLQNKINTGEIVINIEDTNRIKQMIDFQKAELLEKRVVAGLPLYFVKSDREYEAVVVTQNEDLFDTMYTKLTNRKAPDYEKANTKGVVLNGVIVNLKDGYFDKGIVFHEIGHAVDDVTRSNRAYEKNPNIKPIEKNLCHDFITEFAQYATHGQENIFGFGSQQEYSEAIMKGFFYYDSGIRTTDIFKRYKNQCQEIADKFAVLYNIINQDDTKKNQNEILSKVRKADSLRSLNQIADKFLEKYEGLVD